MGYYFPYLVTYEVYFELKAYCAEIGGFCVVLVSGGGGGGVPSCHHDNKHLH